MEKGKRILIVSEVFWPEDFLINDLAQEWQDRGHHVEVLTQYPSYPQSYVFENYRNEGYMTEDWNGIKIHRFPFIEGYRDSKIKKFSNYLSFIFGGRKLAKKIGGDFDVIFVSQTGPLTVAKPAIAAGKKHNIPVAIWTQDIWPDVVWAYGVPKNCITSWILKKVIAGIYRNCDRIFISSKLFKDAVAKYTDKSPIYAPNWLRPAVDEESDLRLDKDKINFTFTGNISRYQNLENTILGFDKAKMDNAVLNIVGDGSYADYLKQLVEEKGISNVIFHGRKPYSHMNDILEQSDVLVLPLLNSEGVKRTEPFKIQSYLNAGKPIIGILGGGGKEIIEENNLGLVADPDDVDDIARVFQNMVSYAKDHAGEVKERSKILMQTRFNKEEIVKTLTENLPVEKRFG